MRDDSLMVSPARGDDDNDVDVPICESPISTAISPTTVRQPAANPAMAYPLPAKPALAHPLPTKPPSTGPASTENTDQKPTAPSSPAPLPALPPRVTTVVPASFVPIETDWSQPLAAADKTLSKSEHARIMLGTLDYYRTGVRKGIVHLASLDQKRIILAQAEADRAGKAAQAAREERARQLQRAQGVASGLGIINPAEDTATKAEKEEKEEKEAANIFTPGYGDFVPPGEMDDMVGAMCAPAEPGIDYNVPTEAMKNALPIQFPVPAFGERPGGRRDHVRQYNEVAEQALMQLAGFEVHMGQQRARWMAVVKQEGAAQAAHKRDAVPPSPPPPPPRTRPPPSAYPPLRDPALRKMDIDMSEV